MPRARCRPRGRGRRTEAERREANRLAMAQRRAAIAAEELERANLERAGARAALPNEVQDQINGDNAHRMAEGRAVLTQEERDEVNALTQQAMSQLRSQLSQRETDEINQERARVRAELSPEQREALNAVNRAASAAARDNETEEEREERNRRNREAMARARARANNIHVAARARSYDPAFPPLKVDLGLRNNLCRYGCNALLFDKELTSARCCSKGKVALTDSQILKQCDPVLKRLLLGQDPRSRDFHAYIRSFNSALGFASMGASASPPPGRGPYCFRIHGTIHHRTGLLHPDNPDEPRVYCQIYMLEGDAALAQRMSNNHDVLDNSTLLDLQQVITNNSPFYNSLRMLRDIEREETINAGLENRFPQSVAMVFAAGPDSRRYNAPTMGDVAAVYVGDENGAPGNQDFCVYPKAGDSLMHIPGDKVNLLSVDSLLQPIVGLNLTELNNLNPPGFPLHNLELKPSVVTPQGHKKSCFARLLMHLDRYPELIVGVRLKIVTIIGQPGREQVVCRERHFVNNRPVETEVTMVRENFVTQYQGTTFTRFQFPLKLETFLQNISPLNHTLDPLVYPLFYPNGETGYFEAIQQQNVQRPKRVSMLEFYAHRLAYREVPFSPLHHGRKLFQQYVVDAWVRTESNRMNYPARFQAELRVERYHALHRHLENLRENPDLPDPGVPTVLPSSFCGGPRYMKQRYDDAMAIFTEDGKPTLFLTHTCNPNHPDIQRNLGNLDPVDGIKLTAADRPDIVTAQ